MQDECPAALLLERLEPTLRDFREAFHRLMYGVPYCCLSLISSILLESTLHPFLTLFFRHQERLAREVSCTLSKQRPSVEGLARDNICEP